MEGHKREEERLENWTGQYFTQPWWQKSDDNSIFRSVFGPLFRSLFTLGDHSGQIHGGGGGGPKVRGRFDLVF